MAREPLPERQTIQRNSVLFRTFSLVAFDGKKFLITKQSTFGRLIPLRGTLQEVGLASTVPGQVFHEWVRQSDGRLSYIGFTKLLHGVTARAAARTNR
jgi:hypothetical protein